MLVISLTNVLCKYKNAVSVYFCIKFLSNSNMYV